MNETEQLRWFDPGLAVCRDLADPDRVVRAGLPVTARARVPERHGLPARNSRAYSVYHAARSSAGAATITSRHASRTGCAAAAAVLEAAPAAWIRTPDTELDGRRPFDLLATGVRNGNPTASFEVSRRRMDAINLREAPRWAPQAFGNGDPAPVNAL